MSPVLVEFPSFTDSLERAPVLPPTPSPLNERAGFAHLSLALTGAALGNQGPGRLYEEEGYGIVYLPEGSDSTGRLEFSGIGSVKNLAPGGIILGHFKSFTVKNGSLSGTAGTAELAILKRPDVALGQLVEHANAGVLASDACGPGGASTQAINSAAGNVPTTAGDGISLTNVKGFRVTVSASAAQTLSGAGTIRLWRRSSSAAGGRWVQSQQSYAVDGTLRDQAFPDEVVTVPDGEVYAEAVNVTTSGGSSLSVNIETWG